MTKIVGFRSGSESGSISQRHGSADPDPDAHQNVMDPQHWYCLLFYCLLVLGIKSNGGGTPLQMYPTAYWKVQEDDTPARTVKTIVHTLVKVRFRLRQHLPIVCSSVSDPDWILIQSGQWIRIRILEGKNYPQN